MNTILGLVTTTKSDASWGTVFPCTDQSKLPSFELLVGGYWFTIIVDDYSFPIDVKKEWCAICLRGMNINYFVLGIPFFRGWYTTFDYETMRVGYVTFKGSVRKTAPIKATTTPSIALPGTEDDETFAFGLSLTQFVIIVSSIAVVGVTATILVIVYCLVARFSAFKQSKENVKEAKAIARV